MSDVDSLHRDDFRLGQPTPTSDAPLDHICPICDGEGAQGQECLCDGKGVISAEVAERIASDDPDPRWKPRPIQPPPAFNGSPCSDCAFRAGSPERDRGLGTARALYDAMESAARDQPETVFWCHQGMHHSIKGYQPRQTDSRGAPLGHPVCAGWLTQYAKRAGAR